MTADEARAITEAARTVKPNDFNDIYAKITEAANKGFNYVIIDGISLLVKDELINTLTAPPSSFKISVDDYGDGNPVRIKIGWY